MKDDVATRLAKMLRVIPDFPVEGVSFKDITTLLASGPAFKEAVDALKEASNGVEYDVIVAPEARGFIVGSALAYATEKAFAPVRKQGKLPYETLTGQYQLEYGQDVLEIHTDAVKPGQKVLVLDDLLATGGTILATIDMIEKLGGTVKAVLFLIELTNMGGRTCLEQRGYEVISVIKLDD